MAITTLSSREICQGASEAKRATNSRAAFMTDQGQPAHLQMSFEHCQQTTRQPRNIADALAMSGMGRHRV